MTIPRYINFTRGTEGTLTEVVDLGALCMVGGREAAGGGGGGDETDASSHASAGALAAAAVLKEIVVETGPGRGALGTTGFCVEAKTDGRGLDGGGGGTEGFCAWGIFRIDAISGWPIGM